MKTMYTTGITSYLNELQRSGCLDFEHTDWRISKVTVLKRKANDYYVTFHNPKGSMIFECRQMSYSQLRKVIGENNMRMTDINIVKDLRDID